ncbi:hypothetical protein AB283_09765 [Lactobacillus amylovorus]|nr:hypothetical protein AB283_09765 [Lactobacillus amylovorus]
MTIKPNTIIKIIVTTLIIANQNSSVAYALALAKLASNKNKIMTIPAIQSLVPGHQKRKYSVVATTSEIPTTIY